jgi:hypothetical protein
MWERMDVLSCGSILDLYVLEIRLVESICVTPTLCKWNIHWRHTQEVYLTLTYMEVFW